MLQGVNRTARKRHNKSAPNFLQGVIMRAQQCRELSTLKGAVLKAQQCHCRIAPTSFIWCQPSIAEMPLYERTKGRVIDASQQCHIAKALPNQFNGVILKTQKCRDIVAPRGEPSNVRRDAYKRALSPASYRGH